jgi:hypothetical protein
MHIGTEGASPAENLPATLLLVIMGFGITLQAIIERPLLPILWRFIKGQDEPPRNQGR